MQPDETTDRIADLDEVDSKDHASATDIDVDGQSLTAADAEPAATAYQPTSSADFDGCGDLPVHSGDDEGGDPPCWLGLIDDQRDHQ